MSPPIIILSDSDDALPASQSVPATISSDATVPVSPAIPTDVPSGNESGETEPFEEGEVTPALADTYADGPLYRPLIGPMTFEQYQYDRYLESQQFLAADDCPSPLPSHHSGSDADSESSDSDDSDSSAFTPPPPPPAPVRRRKRVRVLEPYEPEPFRKMFKYHANGPTFRFTARKRVRGSPDLAAPPPVPASPPSSPPHHHHMLLHHPQHPHDQSYPSLILICSPPSLLRPFLPCQPLLSSSLRLPLFPYHLPLHPLPLLPQLLLLGLFLPRMIMSGRIHGAGHTCQRPSVAGDFWRDTRE